MGLEPKCWTQASVCIEKRGVWNVTAQSKITSIVLHLLFTPVALVIDLVSEV